MYSMYVIGMVKSVQFIEVSLLQGVLIRGITLYMYMCKWMHVYVHVHIHLHIHCTYLSYYRTFIACLNYHYDPDRQIKYIYASLYVSR